VTYEIVQVGRNLRATAGLRSNQKTKLVLKTDNPAIAAEQSVFLAHLLNASELIIDANSRPPRNAGRRNFCGRAFLIVEVDRAAERERLDKEIAKIEAELKTVDAKLKNKSFVDRAPAAIVEEHRQRLKDFSAQLAKLKQAREGLN